MADGQTAPPSSESRTKGALCYIPFIGWIISVFFILTEREDHYTRFNALQSLLLLLLYIGVSIGLDILANVLASVSIAALLRNVIESLLFPIYVAVSIFLIYKGYIGERYMLPKLGVTAEKHM